MESNKQNKDKNEIEKGSDHKHDNKKQGDKGESKRTGLGQTIGSAVNSTTGKTGVTGEKTYQENADKSNISKVPEKTENAKKEPKKKDFKPL